MSKVWIVFFIASVSENLTCSNPFCILKLYLIYISVIKLFKLIPLSIIGNYLTTINTLKIVFNISV